MTPCGGTSPRQGPRRNHKRSTERKNRRPISRLNFKSTVSGKPSPHDSPYTHPRALSFPQTSQPLRLPAHVPLPWTSPTRNHSKVLVRAPHVSFPPVYTACTFQCWPRGPPAILSTPVSYKPTTPTSVPPLQIDTHPRLHPAHAAGSSFASFDFTRTLLHRRVPDAARAVIGERWEARPGARRTRTRCRRRGGAAQARRGLRGGRPRRR